MMFKKIEIWFLALVEQPGVPYEHKFINLVETHKTKRQRGNQPKNRQRD